MLSILTLHGMFFSIVHLVLSVFLNSASYFILCKSAILQFFRKKKKTTATKKTKETTFQYLYVSITVMQLYLASCYPLLYVFVFHAHLVRAQSQSLRKAAFPIEMIPALWKVPPSPVFHTQRDWLRQQNSDELCQHGSSKLKGCALPQGGGTDLISISQT